MHIELKNPYSCSKCGICIEECAKTHGFSRIRTKNKLPIFCKQCSNAPCKEACKVNAIKIVHGIPIINHKLCVGCKLCLENCPYKCIIFKDLVAHKCTLCIDSEKLISPCIEACPNHLLFIKY